MGFQVKVNASTTDKVHVAGLGSFVPGEWTDVTDEQADQFKAATNKPLKSGGLLEVKKTTTKKKEDE